MGNQLVHEHLEQYGMLSVSNLHLLETILGHKSHKRIDKFLKTFDLDENDFNRNSQNIYKTVSLPVEELVYRGLTRCEAEKLAASVALGVRIATDCCSQKLNHAHTPRAIAEYLSPLIHNLDYEVFGLVMMNAKNEIIGNKIVSRGSLTSCIASPRDVFLAAIIAKSAAICVYHNHTSSNPNPSPEDHVVTSTLLQASKILGISLLDHIIISRNSYYSFAENGLIANK